MSSLHIIAGTLKNRALKTPKGAQTRPTTALVRKAVFDRLAPYIEGAHFLDIFAGSGAMGIEALSRGAAKATFIERDKEALHCIYDNLKNLKLTTTAAVLPMDVEKGLRFLKKRRETFDIIYIDPPYSQKEVLVTTLKMVEEEVVLRPGTILMLEEEEPSSEELKSLDLKILRWKDVRQFGKAVIHRFEV